MSKKNKSENEATFETIGDFIGPPSLAVIRLNAITRPNKAASGALEEALVCRMDQDKPTWFVSDLDRPFVSTSPAYSDTLWDLMETCSKVKIQPILPKSTPSSVFENDVEFSIPAQDKTKIDLTSAITSAVKKPQKAQTEFKSPIEESDLSIYGGGIKKKNKNFGRND
jgi:hypothetical protein